MVKTVKRWTNETERVLQACLDVTDWSVFEATANDLDELTEFVTSYISFCEVLCIPTRTRLTYNNGKPWSTAKLRQLCQAKEDAYRKGDKVLYKQAKYTLEKEIRKAKRNYSDKLRIQISSSDSASVWKGMKDITTYKTPSPSTVENQQQADNLNEFYCRFEKHLLWHPPCEGCQWLSSGQLSDQQSSPWLCILVNQTERPFWRLRGSGPSYSRDLHMYNSLVFGNEFWLKVCI